MICQMSPTVREWNPGLPILIPRVCIPQLPPVNTETIMAISLSRKTGHCSGNHQTYFFRLLSTWNPLHHPSITITIIFFFLHIYHFLLFWVRTFKFDTLKISIIEFNVINYSLYVIN